jgi:hypothetical protein
MNLCKYANIFGEPKSGVHSYRFMDIAIVDVLLTVIGGYFISKYFKYKLFDVLLMLFVLSIVIHKIFCVKTTLTKYFID